MTSPKPPSTARATEIEGVVLYRLAPSEQQPLCGGTCLDISRVLEAWRRPLITALVLFLGADDQAAIRFGATFAYFPIVPTIDTPPFPSLDCFLDELPAINAWLQEWSLNADRTPDLCPAWALRHGIEQGHVRFLARAMTKSVAMSRDQILTIESLVGRTGELRIPPKEALSPNSTSLSARDVVVVNSVVEHQVAVSTSGDVFHIPTSIMPRAASAGAKIEIAAASTRRVSAQIVRAIRVEKE